MEEEEAEEEEEEEAEVVEVATKIEIEITKGVTKVEKNLITERIIKKKAK